MKEFEITFDDFQTLSYFPKRDAKYIILGSNDHENGVAYVKDGEFHRLDGPAMEWKDGIKVWMVNGVHHRLDGPSVFRPNGNLNYHINGKQYKSKEEYEIAAYLYKNQLDNYK